MDPFRYLCFLYVFNMLSCLFLAALWSLAGKGLTYWRVMFPCVLSRSHLVSWVRYLIVSISDLCLPS